MNEKILKAPDANAFELKKVKITKDGGVDVHYDVVEVFGDTIIRNKYHVVCMKNSHDDLKKALKVFAPTFAESVGLTSVAHLALSNDSFSQEHRSLMTTFCEYIYEGVEIEGLAIAGKNDNEGIVLYARYYTDNFAIKSKSPRILLSEWPLGSKEIFDEFIRDLEREVYNFLFLDKTAELESLDDVVSAD